MRKAPALTAVALSGCNGEEKKACEYLNAASQPTGQASGAAAEQAKLEFEKVLALDDVERYKEYAENRIEAVELSSKGVETLRRFYEVFRRSFQESLAGNAPKVDAVMSETAPIIEGRDRLNEEI